MLKHYALLGALALSATTAWSQLSFTNASDRKSSVTASGGCMGVVDMNGDGLDYLAILHNARTFQVDYQNADGSFTLVDYGNVSNSPEKRVLDAEVDSVTVPTVSGEAGILPNHASLVSALKPGILSYTQKGGGDKFAVSGGFVEVSGGTVSVLVDTAESADEIDVDAAKAARETAEKALCCRTGIRRGKRINTRSARPRSDPPSTSGK